MARDEDDDLYEEEFDFVDDEEEDDDDDASDVEEDDSDASDIDETPAEDGAAEDADAGELSRAKAAADHVVHIYEHQKFKRTIDRPFTAEDAEAFASEYNRSSKSYGRFALAGKSDAKPKKTID